MGGGGLPQKKPRVPTLRVTVGGGGRGGVNEHIRLSYQLGIRVWGGGVKA
jgi:hypothetical protein